MLSKVLLQSKSIDSVKKKVKINRLTSKKIY